jgi:hypothetical protein
MQYAGTLAFQTLLVSCKILGVGQRIIGPCIYNISVVLRFLEVVKTREIQTFSHWALFTSIIMLITIYRELVFFPVTSS